jgi:hypothetical protein
MFGFLLGLLGSLHCIGMCGAMVMAMSWGLPTAFWWGQVRYHVGKILGYSVLGVCVGLAGKSLSLTFSQQSLSVAVGAVLLITLFLPAYLLHKPNQNTWLTTRLRNAFQSQKSQFLIGFLNAFLPCGLVYIALASALATGEWYDGAIFMAMFGLGTMPALLGVAWAGKCMQRLKKNAIFQRFKVQYALTLVLGSILVLRGLNLGIPYLSPEIRQDATINCCKVSK